MQNRNILSCHSYISVFLLFDLVARKMKKKEKQKKRKAYEPKLTPEGKFLFVFVQSSPSVFCL